jgi:hypothetical protein
MSLVPVGSVGNALLERILAIFTADSTLVSYATAGIYRDVAPLAVLQPQENADAFLTVTERDGPDLRSLCDLDTPGASLEQTVLVIKGLQPASAGLEAQQAVDRAVRILVTETASVTPEGYVITAAFPTRRIAYVEVAGSVLWQHRGALVEVWGHWL